jgi:hypothetical protein
MLIKHDHSKNLSHCFLSRHCILFLDELDTLYFLPQKGFFASPDQLPDLEDAQLLEQLRAHIPTCSICTATLTHARRFSVRQRSMLRKMLMESERTVPSTSRRIMDAVRLK